MQKIRRALLLLTVLTALLLVSCALGEGEYRALRVGNYGDDVLALKNRLYALGFFGNNTFNNRYTEDTAARVKRYEAQCGLPETGVASAALQAWLYSDNAMTAPEALPEAGDGVFRTLSRGNRGDDVAALRADLYKRGLLKSKEGVDYDGALASAVSKLQASLGQPETGVMSVDMQRELYGGGYPTPTPKPTATPKTTATPIAPSVSVALPALNGQGFLLDETAEPFVYADREDGQWYYISQTVAIAIKRYQQETPTMAWLEADIRCTPDAPLVSMLAKGGREDGYNFVTPREIAEQYDALFAISDDFYGGRKLNSKVQGVILRSGEIKADKTNIAATRRWPSLEVLALFSDGSMRAYESDAYTAQQYLDMGVTDTWAFGPILVSGGEVNQELSDKSILRYLDKEPRMALGMIAPYHYVAIDAKGRTTDSNGVKLYWLAERMRALGCTEALNLDGGNTTAMYFMGDVINKVANAKSFRDISSMIGIRAEQTPPPAEATPVPAQ